MHNEEWDWMAAPHPEEHPTHDYIHTVVAKVYRHNLSEEEKKAAAEAEVPSEPLPEEEHDPLADIIPERP